MKRKMKGIRGERDRETEGERERERKRIQSKTYNSISICLRSCSKIKSGRF